MNKTNNLVRIELDLAKNTRETILNRDLVIRFRGNDCLIVAACNLCYYHVRSYKHIVVIIS